MDSSGGVLKDQELQENENGENFKERGEEGNGKADQDLQRHLKGRCGVISRKKGGSKVRSFTARVGGGCGQNLRTLAEHIPPF